MPWSVNCSTWTNLSWINWAPKRLRKLRWRHPPQVLRTRRFLNSIHGLLVGHSVQDVLFRLEFLSSFHLSTYSLGIFEIRMTLLSTYLSTHLFLKLPVYVLASSSIWTWQISNICYLFSSRRRSWKYQNRYSKYDTSKSMS